MVLQALAVANPQLVPPGAGLPLVLGMTALTTVAAIWFFRSRWTGEPQDGAGARSEAQRLAAECLVRSLR